MIYSLLFKKAFIIYGILLELWRGITCVLHHDDDDEHEVRNGISWRATKREGFWKICMALLSEEFLKSSVMLAGYSEMSFVQI
jgi:hypothetical protein